jgi:DNA repair exonuclease SbcCD ATPase subunit
MNYEIKELKAKLKKKNERIRILNKKIGAQEEEIKEFEFRISKHRAVARQFRKLKSFVPVKYYKVEFWGGNHEGYHRREELHQDYYAEALIESLEERFENFKLISIIQTAG